MSARVLKKLCISMLLLLPPAPSFCQGAAEFPPFHDSCSPKREIRAVWLTTLMGLDWPSTRAADTESAERQKQELASMLDRLQAANINTVLFQTRIRGSVVYPSDIEPWDECLTGVAGRAPGYDPLRFAIDECHKRGMELHAWLVTIPLGAQAKQRAFGRASIVRRHPELCKAHRGETFMRPEADGTADYVAKLCKEIVGRYDVDGISLDYIRYPEGSYPSAATPAQRRAHITRIVRRVHDVVKAAKPWVKLSSSPIGKYRDLSRYSAKGWSSLGAVHQEAQEWLKDNLQDVLFPMMYFRGDDFYPFLHDWHEHAHGHAVAPGLGIYLLDPREGRWTLADARAQMYVARRLNIGGMAFYRAKFLLGNRALYASVADELCPFPALAPPIGRGGAMEEPQPPSDIRHTPGRLAWTGGRAGSPLPPDTGNYLLYNVYGSNTYPVDTDDARNLLAPRVRGGGCVLTGRATSVRYYAVTAMDRFGNESRAAQQNLSASFPASSWTRHARPSVAGKEGEDSLH